MDRINTFLITTDLMIFVSYRSGKDGQKGTTKSSPRGSTSSLSQQRLDRSLHAEKSNSLPLQRAARVQDRSVQGRSTHGFVASEVGAQGK